MPEAPHMTDKEDIHYQLLRLLEQNPSATQREIAGELGMSLGKANYCLKGLVDRGWVKANNFKNSDNKAAYLYLLTPKGLKAKAGITLRYLQRKMDEYESLKVEIEELQSELNAQEK